MWSWSAPISSPHQSKTLALSRERGGVYSSALQILIMDHGPSSLVSCLVFECLVLSCHVLSYIVFLLVLSLSLFLPFLALSFLFLCLGSTHKTKQNRSLPGWGGLWGPWACTSSPHGSFPPSQRKLGSSALPSNSEVVVPRHTPRGRRKGQKNQKWRKCCVSVEEGHIQQLWPYIKPSPSLLTLTPHSSLLTLIPHSSLLTLILTLASPHTHPHSSFSSSDLYLEP